MVSGMGPERGQKLRNQPVEPAIYSDYEDYLGYEIRTEVLGPVASNPGDPADQSIHYHASLAIFHNHKEVDGSREHLRTKFINKDEAQEHVLTRGREVIKQFF
jgi:hypothetical protein